MLWFSMAIGFSQEETDPDETSNEAVLVEIVVTAEKREDKLQQVPLTLDVVTDKALESEGIDNTMELQMKTPSLAYNTNGVSQQPYLRGVGGNNLGIGTETSIGVYVDGVNITRTTGIFRELYDVERVEVLKGPQGTLYGRNAAGGAINVITREPEADFSFSGDLTAGNLSKTRAGFTVNAPVSGKFLTRFSALRTKDDGYVDNILLDEGIEAIDWLSARGQFLWLLNDNADLLVTAEVGREDGTRNLAAVIDTREFSPTVDVFGAVIPDDPRQVAYDQSDSLRVDFNLIKARYEYRAEGYTFKSNTAFQTTEMDGIYDGEGSELPILTSTQRENSDTFSQEFLLSRSNARYSWLLGAYYLREDADSSFRLGINENDPAGNVFDPIAVNEITAQALFGQVDWDFSELYRLTLGLRYSQEEKDYEVDHFLNGEVAGTSQNTLDWDAVTPRISFAYRPDDRKMWFISATRGFKSGGVNTIAILPTAEEYNPETLWSYEGGVKTTLAGNRLRFNAAVFYYDYEDLQLNQVSQENITRITNAAQAEIQGLEMSLAAKPSSRFSFDFGLMFLDATFEEYLTADPNGEPGMILDLSGNRLPRAPETSFNIAGNYRIDLYGGPLDVYASYRYQSEVFFTEFETPRVNQDGYGIANARITWTHPKRRWSLSLFGKNLGDKLYRGNVIHADSLIGKLQFFGPPLEYGTTFSYRP